MALLRIAGFHARDVRIDGPITILSPDGNLELSIGDSIRISDIHRKEPEAEWQPIPEGKARMSILDFVSSSYDGTLTNADGHGYLATDAQMSNIVVRPSHALRRGWRARTSKVFTQVIWFD